MPSELGVGSAEGLADVDEGLGDGLALDETGAASPPPQAASARAPAARATTITERRITPRYVAVAQRAVRPGGGVSSISTVVGQGVRPANLSHLTRR